MSQEEAVKICIDKLNSLLICATKKRPDGPPSLLSGTGSDPGGNTSDREKLKSFLAETLAKQLVQKGMKDVSDYELHKLVYAIAEKTALDDGTLAPPPKYPPPLPKQMPQEQYGGYYGGQQGYSYSTAGNANPMM